jgi:hypothetical protein
VCCIPKLEQRPHGPAGHATNLGTTFATLT